jgi:outer membrane protein TolC
MALPRPKLPWQRLPPSSKTAAAAVQQQIHAGREKAQAVRQQLGLSSELAGIDSARASLQNQSELATARAAEALAYVALYKAVGAAPVDAALVTRTREAQP